MGWMSRCKSGFLETGDEELYLGFLGSEKNRPWCKQPEHWSEKVGGYTAVSPLKSSKGMTSNQGTPT